ncbi:nucleotidyltransferase domain-containing protein [Pontixanthobacter luteolus]|uniref:nucleotidyltransferase domain-containing protein n=1 Tax=Pontixanthobacter luteolus TaxID=295089 RepID=UPI0023038989|nr:nucleotidyltransferase family protein [Pontixanthobacter luteolus]
MARIDRKATGRKLLRLLGRTEHQRNLIIENDQEWSDLLALASEHRLMPRLHARLERGEIALSPPDEHRERLRQAHRESALLNLAYRTELFAAVEALAAAGMQPVSLKGAWLAWYAYPSAAERPLRDIDLLLPAEQALPAFELLRARGFRQTEASASAPAEMIGHAKHLPPLTSPTGVEFEIHMHAWEPEGAVEWPMPPLIDNRIIANARPGGAGDPCLYPKPQHMLAHLCIHAVYSHRFDVGPLVLSDIDALIHREQIDWASFWRDAHDGGWHRGAALVMRLYFLWMQRDIQVLSGSEPLAPMDAVDAAESLLFQNPAQRRDLGAAASVYAKGGVFSRIGQIRRRLAGGNRARVPAGGESSESFPAWILRRGKQSASSIADRNLRAAARQHARIGEWLDEGKA